MEPKVVRKIANPQTAEGSSLPPKLSQEQEYGTWQEFEATPWKAQKMLCSNWLPEAGICMLWGPRGAAKSWTALSLAAAIASGEMFLGWRTAEASVLYLDAEMNPAQLKKRMIELRVGSNFMLEKLGKNFAIISHAMSAYAETGFPKLHGGMAGWRILRRVVAARGVKLVVLDNLSSLTRVGNEYEAEDWNYVRDQLLWFRRREVTILLIHHAGKANASGKIDQRGTSFREDIMDTVVKVTVSHQGDDETKVKWVFTKTREGYAGPSFEFVIRTEDGRTVVERTASKEVELKKLNGAGKSVRAIAEETGMSKSSVARHLKRLKGNEIPDRLI